MQAAALALLVTPCSLGLLGRPPAAGPAAVRVDRVRVDRRSVVAVGCYSALGSLVPPHAAWAADAKQRNLAAAELASSESSPVSCRA
eukprot:2446018-Prymnesium_polylepis.1